MTEALHDLHMIQPLDDMLHILPVRACNYHFGSTTVNQSVGSCSTCVNNVLASQAAAHARSLPLPVPLPVLAV